MVAHAWDNNGEDAPPDSAAVVRGGLSLVSRGLSPVSGGLSLLSRGLSPLSGGLSSAYYATLSSPCEKGVD